MKLSLADFEQIVTQNEGKVFNAIYATIGDYEDALDLTQETFIQAYRGFERFRGEAHISTWLYRIAMNLCKRHLSKRKRWRNIIAGSADAPTIQARASHALTQELPADEAMLQEERSQTVQAHILSLPAKYRSVVVLKYLQDLSYEDIADVLKIRVGTVKSRLNRAKQMLEEKLKPLAEH